MRHGENVFLDSAAPVRRWGSDGLLRMHQRYVRAPLLHKQLTRARIHTNNSSRFHNCSIGSSLTIFDFAKSAFSFLCSVSSVDRVARLQDAILRWSSITGGQDLGTQFLAPDFNRRRCGVQYFSWVRFLSSPESIHFLFSASNRAASLNLDHSDPGL